MNLGVSGAIPRPPHNPIANPLGYRISPSNNLEQTQGGYNYEKEHKINRITYHINVNGMLNGLQQCSYTV